MGPTISSNNHPSYDAVDQSALFSLHQSSSSSSSSNLTIPFPTISLELAGGKTVEVMMDAEDDDFSREAKVQKALETAQEAAGGAMELQISQQQLVLAHPGAEKRRRSPSSSSGREESQHREKIQTLEPASLASQRDTTNRDGGDGGVVDTPPSRPGTVRATKSTGRGRSGAHSDSSSSVASYVLSQFCASLAPQVQSFPGVNPENPLPPGLEALASVILTACQGMDAPALVQVPAVPASARRATVASRSLAPGRVPGSRGPHHSPPPPPLGATGTSWALVVSGKAKRRTVVASTTTPTTILLRTATERCDRMAPWVPHGPGSPA